MNTSSVEKMSEKKDLFLAHQQELLMHLAPIKNFLPYLDCCFNPYPVTVPKDVSTNLHALASILIRSLDFVATNYISSESMQAEMPLPKRFLPLLNSAQSQPYRMGTVRPDLIFGERGSIKVCEVNARFPLNGMTISQKINEAVGQASYLSRRGYQASTLSKNICEQMLARFPTDKTLVRVSQSEDGGESQYFLEEFNKLGGQSIQVRPEELSLDSRNNIKLGASTLSNFVLEMDREELFAFDPKVITQIIQNSNYINDVRTLILIHDKRVLSLINDPLIMRPHLGVSEHEFLQRYLLKGKELSKQSQRQEVLTSQKSWVLKRTSGGRGIDLLIGSDTSAGRWGHVINELRSEFTAQEYVSPYKMPITHYVNQDGRFSNPMYLVGSLPCFDGKSFGLGMFRASEHPCVNIGKGQGQAIFLPSAQSDEPTVELRRTQPFQIQH